MARPPDDVIQRALDEQAFKLDQAGHVKVRLDVLSDHEVYANDDGSIGGIFVATGLPLPMGTTMTIEVQFPWGEVLVAEGTVVWTSQLSQRTLRQRAGMGVGFVDLAPEQKDLLVRAMILREPLRIPPDAQRAQPAS